MPNIQIIFWGLEKLKGQIMKLHVDPHVKPVAAKPLPLLHLKARAEKAIEEMIQQNIIEEHLLDQQAPRVSNLF